MICWIMIAKGGFVLVGAFDPGPHFAKAGSALGILDSGRQRMDRIAFLWRYRASVEKLCLAVASWTGCSARKARVAMQDNEALMRGWFRLFDQIEARRSRSGLDSAGHLQHAFSWSLEAYPADDVISRWCKPWLGLVDSRLDEDYSTRVLLFERSAN